MSLVVDDMPDLGITRLSRWIFNGYVLHSGDGAVVVDAGLPQVVGDLAAVLDRLGGTVHAVVATHGHSDHVAGAAELAARHRAPIWLPATAHLSRRSETPYADPRPRRAHLAYSHRPAARSRRCGRAPERCSDSGIWHTGRYALDRTIP